MENVYTLGSVPHLIEMAQGFFRSHHGNSWLTVGLAEGLSPSTGKAQELLVAKW